jgi:hypothetical protein
MNVRSLEGGFLISIALEQNHSFLEMEVITEDGNAYKAIAFNHGGTPIKVTMGAISFRAGLHNHANRLTLGEIEGVSHTDGMLVIEGDFGDITINADHLEFQGASK